MKTLILLSMLLSSYSWAQGITLPEGFSSEGHLELRCGEKYGGFNHNTPTRLEVSNYGEGKVRLSLFASYVSTVNDYRYKQVSRAFSLHYIGIENGIGSYDLFSANDRSFGKVVGEMILHKTSVSLNFFATVADVTVGSRDDSSNTCSIKKTNAIRFDAVKPKCFNRRGKEISCPDIRF